MPSGEREYNDMGKINIYNNHKSYATYVPNTFIDRYMTHADGEYVKIYLYLLRCMNQPQADFSISRFADHFEHTEKDILRALKYWEKANLLRLEYDEEHNLSGICILNDTVSPQAPAAGESTVSAARTVSSDKKDPEKQSDSRTFISAAAPRKTEYTPEELSRFCEQDEIAEMIFVAEQYLGRSLSSNDLNHIFSWYDQLHFSVDFIEFLIETCVSRGHTSIYYIEKVAEDFAARNIYDVEEARQTLNNNSRLYHTVMKSFGIRGRNLVPSEVDYITHWNSRLGFSEEMIEEACKRTMAAIHEPSFQYADSILKNWEKNGIFQLKDISRADIAYRQKNRSGKKSAAVKQNRATGFSNFRQRVTDYDDLQKQLIRRSMEQ